MTVDRNDVLPDLFVIPDIARSTVEVRFTAPPGCNSADWRILDDGGPVASGTVRTTVGKQASFTAELPGAKLWNVHSPHLYRLEILWSGEGGEIRTAETFGMRQIATDGGTILVNEQPFLLRGYIRGREAHDHPNLLGLPPAEYYARNIRMAKEYGFNFVRFHSQVPPEECFAQADRLGIFIHVELRTYFGIYQKERAGLDDKGELIDLDEWRAMILRLRNHPSLMVYCIGNEIRHPGANPRVEEIARVAKELDPTRLFIDTCAHGEFDRTYVDIDVQHMTYFYPFGKDYDMFENTRNWLIYGSCKDLPMVSPPLGAPAEARVTRSLAPSRPIIAHEVCHYVALRDMDKLDRKFAAAGATRPWWIDELRKLVDAKGLAGDYARMRDASKRFQMIGWKLGIEGARRSRILGGFHFLQLSDTERYENSNGIVDCFDDPTGVDPAAFAKFNSDTAILADLPRRTFFEGEKLSVPVIASHFSPEIAGEGDFAFTLASAGGAVNISGGLDRIDMDRRGRREICRIEIDLPATDAARAMKLECRLTGREGGWRVVNDWNLWVYPDRPAELAFPPCRVDLEEVEPRRRYPQLADAAGAAAPKLLIAHRFDEGVFEHLSAGGDVLMLYRVAETRDRRTPAGKEKFYLPATWDRFKGVVWDRGTNLGAFMRPGEALAGFPNDGLVDMQFHSLIDDADKLCLDDFPVPVEPIMQGVDKASRDRFDVFTFKLSELQAGWTMRKFAYLFELRVGAGRLLVSGFNLTGIDRRDPGACAMFESLVRYVSSDAFAPAAEMSPAALRDYLLAKGAAPRVKERMMTQYWQLNDAPLESAQYWLDAEAYIRQG
jgi:hypothetical protein